MNKPKKVVQAYSRYGFLRSSEFACTTFY